MIKMGLRRYQILFLGVLMKSTNLHVDYIDSLTNLLTSFDALGKQN